jgi:hypothetical protein
MGRILAVGEYLDRFAELEQDFDKEKETGDFLSDCASVSQFVSKINFE